MEQFFRMLFERLAQSLLKPFDVFAMSIRNNHPWHRSNFKPCHFPFYMKQKVTGSTSFQARTKTRGGRLILMRNVLMEKPYLSWNYQTKPPEKRLSFPL